MNYRSAKRDLILEVATQKGLLRPRDLEFLGISGTYLHHLVGRGDLIRGSRGLYHLPTAEFTEHHSLAEIAKRLPQSVICLLSAARFHNLGTETPCRIWVALPRGSKRPCSGALPLHLSWYSHSAMQPELGIERHLIEGVPVRITSMARTLVDLFRARNKVGMEVVLDAFRDGLHRNASIEEIQAYAAKFHAAQTLQPYLEALL